MRCRSWMSVCLISLALSLLASHSAVKAEESWSPIRKSSNKLISTDSYYKAKYGTMELTGAGNLAPWPTHSNQPYWVLKEYGIVDSATSNLKGYYLLSGPLTKPAEMVTKNAANIQNGKTLRETVENIFDWEHAVDKSCSDEEKLKLGFDPSENNFPNDVKRNRTAAQIIQSKCFTGCTDFVVVFAALARAKGIPATVTETISEGWVAPMVWNQAWDGHKKGHFFSEVYLQDEDRWVIVDPTARLFSDRNEAGYYKCPTDDEKITKKCLLFERGLDHGDYGVETSEDLSNAVKKRYYIEGDQP